MHAQNILAMKREELKSAVLEITFYRVMASEA